MIKTIGIDAGGTLTKVAFRNENGELEVQHYSSTKLHDVANFINDHDEIQTIGLTGGRAEQLNALLHERTSKYFLVEFEATLRGVNAQLKAQKNDLSTCMITNIGSGTSIHFKNGEAYSRVGGTGIGGGTLVGLSALMTKQYEYETITKMAVEGNRQKVDLMVADIFEGMEVPKPLNPNLTASNFGKVGLTADANYEPEDLIATTTGLVGEVVSTLSVQLAEQYGASSIVYIGTTLWQNPRLKQVIMSYTEMKKKTAVFLEDEGYSGAIGALLHAENQID